MAISQLPAAYIRNIAAITSAFPYDGGSLSLICRSDCRQTPKPLSCQIFHSLSSYPKTTCHSFGKYAFLKPSRFFYRSNPIDRKHLQRTYRSCCALCPCCVLPGSSRTFFAKTTTGLGTPTFQRITADKCSASAIAGAFPYNYSVSSLFRRPYGRQSAKALAGKV